MFRRSSKTQIDDSLQLPLSSGEPGLSFPTDIIDNLRYLVTRTQRKQEKPADAGFPACVALASAVHGEGVTYLSHALAAMLASDLGVPVAIVDLNWHSQSHSPFVTPKAPGIAQVIDGQATLDDITVPTGWGNLSILPAGSCPPARRHALARSTLLPGILAQARSHYQILILDLPPILATSDAIPLASLADACCLVIRQGKTRAGDVAAALDEISNLPVLGMILNRAYHATPAPIMHLIIGRNER